MFGSHLSIAGGMVNALHRARELKLECLQVFTKNQRQWSVKPLADEDRDAWLDELSAMGWLDDALPGGSRRVVSHNSYLINLASPDAAAWEKSCGLQRVELERCEALRIPFCVSHPGAHLGASRKPSEPNVLDGTLTKDERAGLKRIAKALNRLHRELKGGTAITCLETTVGSGTNLGYDFHHLAFIRDLVKEPERVGFCLDTCHVTAAGYDMTTREKADEVLGQFDTICGLSNLHAIHLNDSVGAVGSRKDRHAHIGRGTCGMSCFEAIVNHPALADVPMVLETPKEDDETGRPWDLVNIGRLKRLIARPVTSR
ncbi:MAG: deoxyribonuclease IV [Phycisphaerales bacterium]|nr:deoxyribonuclease IV [Phycisphaerales bacterium]